MAVTVEKFRQTFEEFRKTEGATIQAKLDVAKLQVEPSVWGDKTDAGVLYLTAHLVAMSPAGMNAKLKPSEREALYKPTYTALKKQVTFGLRTAGVPPAGAFNEPIC